MYNWIIYFFNRPEVFKEIVTIKTNILVLNVDGKSICFIYNCHIVYITAFNTIKSEQWMIFFFSFVVLLSLMEDGHFDT